MTTSGRKLRTHSVVEMLYLLLRLTVRGTRVIKQRQGMELWYGERREEGGAADNERVRAGATAPDGGTHTQDRTDGSS